LNAGRRVGLKGGNLTKSHSQKSRSKKKEGIWLRKRKRGAKKRKVVEGNKMAEKVEKTP